MSETVSIIGAGRLGTTLARLSLQAGYSVLITNSRGPETLGLQLSVLLPGAVASTPEEIAQKSNLIILAIPLRQYKTLAPGLFEGKIVIDAMNYWAPVEGHVEEFAGDDFSSSKFIQHYFTGARVVKSLNHIAYNELESDSQPNAPLAERRAILMASDDASAKNVVARLITAIGFAPVDAGPLARGTQFAPDTQLFNTRFSANDISAILGS